MKKIDPDDPKLTAYALGELEASERAAMEAALTTHPECRALVDEIQQTAALLSNTLAKEPCPSGRGVRLEMTEGELPAKHLEADSAEALLAASPSQSNSSPEKIVPFPRRRMFAIAAAIAASLVAVTIWQSSYRDNRRKGHSSAGNDNKSLEKMALLFPTQVIPPTAHGTNVSQGVVANATSTANKVSAASLTLRDATLSEVIDLYETLGGRTVIRPTQLREAKLNVRSEREMTRAEAVQALETILAMNQLTTIPQGEKFVKVVSQQQAVTEGKPFTENSVSLDSTAAQQNESHLYTITPNDWKDRVQVGTMAPLTGVSVFRTDNHLVSRNNYADSSPAEGTTLTVSGSERKKPATLAGERISIREQEKRNRGLSASVSGAASGTVYSLNSAGLAPQSPTILSARFSPDGKKVLAISPEGDTRIWDAKTGKPWGESRQEIVAYAPFVENGFQSVVQQPLSTFSIDVDTASYANVRRFLNQNRLPPRDAVRIEEMINYFSYDYVQPKGDEPFAASLEVAGCPWNAEHRLVRVALKGREMPQDKRPPSNFVFLIDISGSMQPAERLPLIKQGLRMLVKKMNEGDRVAIVVYASTSGVRLLSTSCAEKEKILAAIDALEAAGSTNGGDGIQQAYATARENVIKGGVNRVILCTDGDFNVGITDQNELVRLIQEQARSGVFLSALGVGTDNYKDDLMQKLADKGNGNYHYIDTLEEAQKVLIEQMNGTLVTIAKDVKIQIEFNPAQVSAYRLIGYEKRLLRKEDFNNDKKDAGEIGAGHTVTAFYEIVPAGRAGVRPVVDTLKYQPAIAPATFTANEVSNELLTLKLRYKQPDGNTSKLLEFPATDSGMSYGKASADFKFATAVGAFGMLLRDSEYKGSANFEGILELAEEGKGVDAGGYRAEFINLVKKARSLK